jgi:hypothetical protein
MVGRVFKLVSAGSLDMIRSVCKVAISCYSLHCFSLSAWNNTVPSGRVIMKFDVGEFFEKSVEKIQI